VNDVWREIEPQIYLPERGKSGDEPECILCSPLTSALAASSLELGTGMNLERSSSRPRCGEQNRGSSPPLDVPCVSGLCGLYIPLLPFVPGLLHDERRSVYRSNASWAAERRGRQVNGGKMRGL
jgi:hypothetical protein